MYLVQYHRGVTTSRRQRAPKLSRERLIRAALDLIDTDGVEKLTVRRVATTLDVTPMALYWHFAGKDELLDGIGDAIATRIDLSGIDADATWDVRLAALMRTLISTLAIHSGAAEIAMRRLLYTDQGRRVAELGLGALREAGLRGDDAFLVGRYALRTAVAVASEPVFTGASVSAERALQLQHEFDQQLDALPEAAFPVLRSTGDGLRAATDAHRYQEVSIKLFIDGLRHF